MKNVILTRVGGHISWVLAGVWLAWMIADLLDATISYQVSRYASTIDVYGFGDTLPWPRWVVEIAGLAILILRREDPERTWPLMVWVGGICVSKWLTVLLPIASIYPPVALLWTPHLSWALALSLLLYAAYPVLGNIAGRQRRYFGPAVLVLFAILYVAYGIVFVRITLLHGDEPQFLMTAQSLVLDGDIDLSNLGDNRVKEFHQVTTVGPHKAPASPPGKIHNVHPPGTSLVFAPAYWFGLTFLDHPRLPVALMVSVFAALTLFMLYRLLDRIGFDPLISGVCCIVFGLTPLLVLYSNQIYPDLIALVLTIPTLIHWASDARSRRFQLMCLGMVLLLPAVHPRLLPLMLLLIWLLWDTIRKTDERERCLKLGCGVIGAAALLYVFYHLHYTGDIWGPYKSGNVWKAYTLTIGSTLRAIAGQWIDVNIGLLNSAPVFAMAFIGLVMMIRSERRQLAFVALALYAVTAGVNANSDDWRFGYCFPSRFMLTSLPALVLPFAVVMERGLRRDPWLLILTFLGFVVSLDTTQEALRLPEAAYLGKHLNRRAITTLYPLGAHLPDLTTGDAFPWMDTLVWVGLLAVPIAIAIFLKSQRPLALGVFALLFPGVSASVIDYPGRMTEQTSWRMLKYDQPGEQPNVSLRERTAGFTPSDGVIRQDRLFTAREDTRGAGVVGYSALPYLTPSVYGVILPLQSNAEAVNGTFVLAERASVRAYGNHETRWSIPISIDTQFGFNRVVRSSGVSTAYQFVTFDGKGTVQFGETKTAINPVQIIDRSREVFSRSMNLPEEGEQSFTFSFEATNLDAGFYRLRIELDDVPLSTLVKRRADPVMIVIYEDNLEVGREKARNWVPMLGRAMEAVPPEGSERPMVESYLAPFWSLVPVLGEQRMQIEFENPKKQSIYIAGGYRGEIAFRLENLTLEKRTLFVKEEGEVKSLTLPKLPGAE